MFKTKYDLIKEKQKDLQEMYDKDKYEALKKKRRTPGDLSVENHLIITLPDSNISLKPMNSINSVVIDNNASTQPQSNLFVTYKGPIVPGLAIVGTVPGNEYYAKDLTVDQITNLQNYSGVTPVPTGAQMLNKNSPFYDPFETKEMAQTYDNNAAAFKKSWEQSEQNITNNLHTLAGGLKYTNQAISSVANNPAYKFITNLITSAGNVVGLTANTIASVETALGNLNNDPSGTFENTLGNIYGMIKHPDKYINQVVKGNPGAILTNDSGWSNKLSTVNDIINTALTAYNPEEAATKIADELTAKFGTKVIGKTVSESGSKVGEDVGSKVIGSSSGKIASSSGKGAGAASTGKISSIAIHDHTNVSNTQSTNTINSKPVAGQGPVIESDHSGEQAMNPFVGVVADDKISAQIIAPKKLSVKENIQNIQNSVDKFAYIKNNLSSAPTSGDSNNYLLPNGTYQQFISLNNGQSNQICSGLYQISWPYALSVVVENNPLSIAPLLSFFIGVRDSVSVFNPISTNMTSPGGLPDSSVGNWAGIIWYPNLPSPPDGNFTQVYYVDSAGHKLTIRFDDDSIIAAQFTINEYTLNDYMVQYLNYNNPVKNEYLRNTASFGMSGLSTLIGDFRNIFFVVNGTASVTVVPAPWSIS